MTSREKRTNGGQGSKLHFTPPRVTPDEILQRGQASAALMESPVFFLAVQSVLRDSRMQVTATQPEEVKKREYLYTKQQALGDILQHLDFFTKEAMQLSAAKIHDEEQDQRQRREDQGFGTAQYNAPSNFFTET